MQYAIELERVSKRFPRRAGYKDILTFWRRQYMTALDGVSLRVPQAGVFGLLGPNGAGKTTLLKILAGLVLPDEGQVRINGVDVAEHPGKSGHHLMYVSGEERSLYWRLTGKQNLRFFAVLNEVPRRRVEQRVGELLSLVGLVEAADERVVKYSTGMKQRLAIARGLLADPDILLLDEPTKSLDPVRARDLWTFIKEDLVGRHHKTLVIATHNMEEATYLCDQVAILHRGEVKACDTVAALADRLSTPGRRTIIVNNTSYETIAQLRNLAGVHSVNTTARNGHQDFSLEVVVEEPDVHIPLVVEHLVRVGGRVVQVAQERASLGDVIAALSEKTR